MPSRPPFPTAWSSLPISPANLSLANTLPVGQSFFWHRHALTSDLGSSSPRLNNPRPVSLDGYKNPPSKVDAQPGPSPAGPKPTLTTTLEPSIKSEPEFHHLHHPDAHLATEEYSRTVSCPPRVVLLRQTPSRIYYTSVHPTLDAAAADTTAGTTREWLMDYFQLNQYPDLGALYSSWSERDPRFFGPGAPAELECTETKVGTDVKAEGKGSGLGPRAVGVRVLRQEPWECLVAFITSTNNHIPRITSLLHKLAAQFSPPLLSLDAPDGSGVVEYRLFPRPSEIAAAYGGATEGDDIDTKALETTLREIGFGYRAGFLASSLATLREAASSPPVDGSCQTNEIKSQSSSDLDAVSTELLRWRTLPPEDTRGRLMELKGVGRKVADCVMLMCMDQPATIPIDTHIHAIANRHPGLPSRLRPPSGRKATMTPALYEGLQEFLAEQWGPLGGWCQAVVFAADLKNVAAQATPKPTPTPTATPKKAVPSQKATPKNAGGRSGVTSSNSASPTSPTSPTISASAKVDATKVNGKPNGIDRPSGTGKPNGNGKPSTNSVETEPISMQSEPPSKRRKTEAGVPTRRSLRVAGVVRL